RGAFVFGIADRIVGRGRARRATTTGGEGYCECTNKIASSHRRSSGYSLLQRSCPLLRASAREQNPERDDEPHASAATRRATATAAGVIVVVAAAARA